ncbi:hypothetical protein MKW92_015346, partial [Papaver armeniacum]
VSGLNIEDSDNEYSSGGEEEASTRAKSKGKVLASKAPSKNINKKNNPNKKRKITSTNSSPTPSVLCPQGNELPFPDAYSSTYPMTQLSLIFKDSLAAIGDDNLVRTCQMISNICNAPIMSHESLRGAASAISPEFLLSL